MKFMCLYIHILINVMSYPFFSGLPLMLCHKNVGFIKRMKIMIKAKDDINEEYLCRFLILLVSDSDI